VRLARKGQGLTQRDLSRRCGVAQPNIAALESTEGKDANVATVERLLAATGGRLTVIPSRAITVAEVASQIAELLSANLSTRAYRVWLALHDSLRSAEPAVRVALAVAPPAPTGDRNWDALLAGLVDHDLARLPTPSWVHEPGRVADGWFVDRAPGFETQIKRRTPAAFRRHGIWIDAAELKSV